MELVWIISSLQSSVHLLAKIWSILTLDSSVFESNLKITNTELFMFSIIDSEVYLLAQNSSFSSYKITFR